MKECLDGFPILELDAQVKRATQSVVQVLLKLKTIFGWQVSDLHSHSQLRVPLLRSSVSWDVDEVVSDCK